MTTRRRVWVVLLAVGCADAGEEEGEIGSDSAAVSVTWTNLVRVAASGNDLTKTGTAINWNAGAVTVETLAGDGYVEFTTAENTTSKQAGLSSGDSGTRPSDIDFAIRLRASGSVGVYEAGVLIGSFGRYAAGDVFRVETRGGVVTYRKNGALLYTSAVAPSFPLLVDTALYDTGATLNDVVLVATGVTWQNAVGVSAAGNDLTRTATTSGWTAGASTVQALGGDGHAEFTTGENTTTKMLGLSYGDDSLDDSDIDFAIWLGGGGTVRIYEGGVFVRNAGTYIAGDRFRIEVSGGQVQYSKNGARPFHTSAVAPTFPLLVDTALLTPGATLKEVALYPDEDACLPYDGAGRSCSGSFFIANEIDVADIADCAAITGNLTIQAPGMTEVSLPNLEAVGGTLSVSGNPDLIWLRLPRLKQVGRVYLSLGVRPTAMDLSHLRTVTGPFESIASFTDSFEISTPCLDSAGDFLASNAGKPGKAHVPRLREVLGDLDGKMTAPLLETVAGDVTGALDAPALALVGGGVLASPLDAPSLTEAGFLAYKAGQSVPALERVGELTLTSSLTSIDLPALVEVTASLSAGSYGGTSCFTPPSATTLALPSLRRAGTLFICWDGLETLSLPELSLLTGAPPFSGALSVRSATLTSVELPALTAVEAGWVDLRVPSSVPSLTTVAGSLYVYAPMDAPVLTTVGDSLYVWASVTAPELLEVGGYLHIGHSLSAPALQSIGRLLQAYSTTSPIAVSLPSLTIVDGISGGGINLTSLDLPSLTTIVGAFGNSESGSVSITGSQLTALSLPLVAAIPKELRINDNGSLTSLDFSSLTSLGPSLKVRYNDVLPTCYATNLRDQLLASGWTGTANIIGNDNSGTCP